MSTLQLMQTLRNNIQTIIESLGSTYVRSLNINDLNQQVLNINLSTGSIGVLANIPDSSYVKLGMTKTQQVTYSLTVYFLQLNSGADDTGSQVDAILDTTRGLAESFLDRLYRLDPYNNIAQPDEYTINGVDTVKIADDVLSGVQLDFQITERRSSYDCT